MSAAGVCNTCGKPCIPCMYPDSDIQNWQKQIGGAWDWHKLLAGCFGEGKIRITNIDGMAERRAEFLFIETKGVGVPIPTGQDIAFRNLKLKLGPQCLFLIISGPRNNPMEIVSLGTRKCDDVVIDNVNLETLRKLCSDWYRRVDY